MAASLLLRLNGGDTFVKFDPATNRSALRNLTDVLIKHEAGVITNGTVHQLLKHFPEVSGWSIPLLLLLQLLLLVLCDIL